MTIYGVTTYSSVTSYFLFWEIERVSIPEEKTIIRLRRKANRK